jgi:ABC-2 type transport system ATP-binding protein
MSDAKPDALRLRNLQKSFGVAGRASSGRPQGKKAVDGLDLTIRPGEFYALLGANGAGKTTTLRMIAGLLQPDAGEILIDGVDARRDPIAAKQRIAWLPDEPLLYDKLTPLEYLEFVSGLWGMKADEAGPRAENLLRRLNLWEQRNQRCEGFSRGMRQKTALAGALIHGPRLLMLDEPLTGLDAGAARQVKDILAEQTRSGAAVILTTHILEVAEKLADRIGIIADGKLIAEGDLDHLKSLSAAQAASLEDVFLDLTAHKAATREVAA